MVNMMKEKLFLIAILIFGFFLILNTLPAHAQKPPKTLTILYSNNLNGEIEPCPS